MAEVKWSAQYDPPTIAAISEADRAYTAALGPALRDYWAAPTLAAAMEAYNSHMNYAHARWKQTVKEAIENANAF